MSTPSASPISFVDPHESLESVLERSPAENLKTPTKKTAPILPLKRTSSEALGDDNKENQPPAASDDEADEENVRMGQLDPRKLDIDGRVLFGNENKDDDEKEEGETDSPTQPYVPSEPEQDVSIVAPISPVSENKPAVSNDVACNSG